MELNLINVFSIEADFILRGHFQELVQSSQYQFRFLLQTLGHLYVRNAELQKFLALSMLIIQNNAHGMLIPFNFNAVKSIATIISDMTYDTRTLLLPLVLKEQESRLNLLCSALE